LIFILIGTSAALTLDERLFELFSFPLLQLAALSFLGYLAQLGTLKVAVYLFRLFLDDVLRVLLGLVEGEVVSPVGGLHAVLLRNVLSRRVASF
jgi:hypothetical protein